MNQKQKKLKFTSVNFQIPTDLNYEVRQLINNKEHHITKVDIVRAGIEEIKLKVENKHFDTERYGYREAFLQYKLNTNVGPKKENKFMPWKIDTVQGRKVYFDKIYIFQIEAYAKDKHGVSYKIDPLSKEMFITTKHEKYIKPDILVGFYGHHWKSRMKRKYPDE